MRYLIILDREVLAKASDTSVERQQSTRKALGKAQKVGAESESLYLSKGFWGEEVERPFSFDYFFDIRNSFGLPSGILKTESLDAETVVRRNASSFSRARSCVRAGMILLTPDSPDFR